MSHREPISDSAEGCELRRELEICIDEPQSARAAVGGGADRLEVCSALAVGGLTPSAGLITLLKAELSIPLHAMIRPRSGGFVYSEDESRMMIDDVRHMADLGCAGVVFGVLSADGAVDYALAEKLVRAAGPLHCGFHRAIDTLDSPLCELQRLRDLGVTRLLSSGGEPTAVEGALVLAAMQEQAPEGLQIMAGSGVNAGNLSELLKRTGVLHVHGSAATGLSLDGQEGKARPGGVDFTRNANAEFIRRQTSKDEVRALRVILDRKATAMFTG